MNRHCHFKLDNYICDLRTVGILVKDRKVPVQRDKDGNEYALPAGHVKLGETTADGLIREYKEETGTDIHPIRLLWTEECFWEWSGIKAHNLSFTTLSNCAVALIFRISGNLFRTRITVMPLSDRCLLTK